MGRKLIQRLGGDSLYTRVLGHEFTRKRVGVEGRSSFLPSRWKTERLSEKTPGALSIRPKIPEIPGWGANGIDIFRNFIPKFWEYLARLA